MVICFQIIILILWDPSMETSIDVWKKKPSGCDHGFTGLGGWNSKLPYKTSRLKNPVEPLDLKVTHISVLEFITIISLLV